MTTQDVYAVKTENDNFLIAFDNKKCCYANSNFEFLRQATFNEFSYLLHCVTDYAVFDGTKSSVDNLQFEDLEYYYSKSTEGLIKLDYDEKIKELEDKIPQLFEIEEINSEIVDEDYSEYDERFASNGGKYGFWTKRHYIEIKNDKEKYQAWYDTFHTTSDIQFCSCCGTFNPHGYKEASILLNDKLVGFTDKKFPGNQTIYVY